MEFRSRHEPIPIEIRIPPDDPGQRLTEPRLEVVHPERRKEELRRVVAAAPLEMSEPWIPKGGETLGKALRVRLNVGRVDRQRCRGHGESAVELRRQAPRYGSAAVLQERQVRLGHTKTRRSLLLRPAPAFAFLT